MRQDGAILGHRISSFLRTFSKLKCPNSAQSRHSQASSVCSPAADTAIWVHIGSHAAICLSASVSRRDSPFQTMGRNGS